MQRAVTNVCNFVITKQLNLVHDAHNTSLFSMFGPILSPPLCPCRQYPFYSVWVHGIFLQGAIHISKETVLHNLFETSANSTTSREREYLHHSKCPDFIQNICLSGAWVVYLGGKLPSCLWLTCLCWSYRSRALNSPYFNCFFLESHQIDGYLARRFNMSTVLGTILDPAADKALMTTLTVTLAMQDLIPGMWNAHCRWDFWTF